jgi:hypothetical protein
MNGGLGSLVEVEVVGEAAEDGCVFAHVGAGVGAAVSAGIDSLPVLSIDASRP